MKDIKPVRQINFTDLQDALDASSVMEEPAQNQKPAPQPVPSQPTTPKKPVAVKTTTPPPKSTTQTPEAAKSVTPPTQQSKHVAAPKQPTQGAVNVTVSKPQPAPAPASQQQKHRKHFDFIHPRKHKKNAEQVPPTQATPTPAAPSAKTAVGQDIARPTVKNTQTATPAPNTPQSPPQSKTPAKPQATATPPTPRKTATAPAKAAPKKPTVKAAEEHPVEVEVIDSHTAMMGKSIEELESELYDTVPDELSFDDFEHHSDDEDEPLNPLAEPEAIGPKETPKEPAAKAEQAVPTPAAPQGGLDSPKAEPATQPKIAPAAANITSEKRRTDTTPDEAARPALPAKKERRIEPKDKSTFAAEDQHKEDIKHTIEHKTAVAKQQEKLPAQQQKLAAIQADGATQHSGNIHDTENYQIPLKPTKHHKRNDFITWFFYSVASLSAASLAILLVMALVS